MVKSDETPKQGLKFLELKHSEFVH